jgi:hypothetical protein
MEEFANVQLMTWPLARLGSRFGLLFEPGSCRVMHSALGRFLDQPLDLAVGLVEPDGSERVLPFTQHGKPFYGCEQFERINSVTFRGHSETAGLRFELNFHSPFYPQDEQLCLMPMVYMELRVTWASAVRVRQFTDGVDAVKLFIRLGRPQTQIDASNGRIDLRYDVPLAPSYTAACGDNRTDTAIVNPDLSSIGTAHVTERIQSLNDGAVPTRDPHGNVGLTLTLPVTEEGSGIKWRLVWAAHTADPVLNVRGEPAKFRYTRHWKDIDAVIADAIAKRDDTLALSRRFEKLLEQAPLDRSRWHLLVLAFQSYLSNTWWCDLANDREFFSVWEGNFMFHNTLDVGYNISLFYFTVWPRLLKLCLEQWAGHGEAHGESGGFILHHDMGRGCRVGAPAYRDRMPVEENSNFLLMLQAYVHWTSDKEPATKFADLVRRLADYLAWTDRDSSGFPSQGTANTLDDGSPAVHSAQRQTYLAIKRVAALDAAADLLERAGDKASADRFESIAAAAVPKIETESWLADHYAVCVDKDSDSGLDGHVGETILFGPVQGWDDYSIYTANALLLPLMIAQPVALDRKRLSRDLANAARETLMNYGCGHTSSDSAHVWVSQNLWRDHISRYLRTELAEIDSRYWDLMVFSNTYGQSSGYTDTYLSNELVFNPRGVVAFGAFLAGPRLIVDKLDDAIMAVDPDRHRPSRWPLLPLADWDAGRVPICVVNADGNVSIEGEIEPVKIIGKVTKKAEDTIG